MAQTLVALVFLLAFVKPQPAVHVVMQTDLGEIEVEIDGAQAPVTAANFMKYVEADFTARCGRTTSARSRSRSP